MSFGLCSLVVRKKRLEEGEDTLGCLQFKRKQNSGVGRENVIASSGDSKYHHKNQGVGG